MIIQWILQILAVAIVGCVIGYFLIRIFTKLRVFLIRKSSKFIESKEKIEEIHDLQFYNTFGFYYEDLIKYAPELDEFITSQVNPHVRDRVVFKMIKMREIYESINAVEQIDIMKFKQTIENIKNQKLLENIDG